jgi:ketoreductase RED2
MTPTPPRRVAVVTGSTRGIGRAVVERFVAAGWACVLNGRHEREETREPALGDAAYVAADVGAEAGARRLVAATLERWGRLDLVVNNAAYTRRIPHRDLDAVDTEFWEQVLRVNVLGPWHVVRAAAPALRETGGSVVNVSSLAARKAAGSCIPYAVSKAALNHLTLLLANALAPDVRVNAVAPGFVDNERGDDRRAVREHVVKRAPLRRPGRPDEVADACLWLADATYVTGEVVTVDGGLHVL